MAEISIVQLIKKPPMTENRLAMPQKIRNSPECMYRLPGARPFCKSPMGAGQFAAQHPSPSVPALLGLYMAWGQGGG